MSAVPFVLDTDIGTDVDDLLALLVLIGHEGADLKAVTTVYGDTDLRSRIVARILRLTGQEDVVIGKGIERPMSGRPLFWPGHEPLGFEDEPAADTVDAVEVLSRQAQQHPGELVVAAIGPLTNIAATIQADEMFAGRVQTLLVMGGHFGQPSLPEHNLRADIVATRQVVASGISIIAVGLDQTQRVLFTDADLAAATSSETELAALVRRRVNTWWKFLDSQGDFSPGGPVGNNPHDPIALYAVLEPHMFTFRTAAVDVSAGDDPGRIVAGQWSLQVAELRNETDVRTTLVDDLTDVLQTSVR